MVCLHLVSIWERLVARLIVKMKAFENSTSQFLKYVFEAELVYNSRRLDASKHNIDPETFHAFCSNSNEEKFFPVD